MVGTAPTGPISTTWNPREPPRWTSRLPSAVCCSLGSLLVSAPSSCRFASATAVFTSTSTASTRWSSRPFWVCWSSTQPTAETTTAESTTMLATTRAWIDRRQKVSARRISERKVEPAIASPLAGYETPAL